MVLRFSVFFHPSAVIRGPTYTVQETEAPAADAVIRAAPACFAVTTPSGLTSATFGSLLTKDISSMPSASTSCSDVPGSMILKQRASFQWSVSPLFFVFTFTTRVTFVPEARGAFFAAKTYPGSVPAPAVSVMDKKNTAAGRPTFCHNL